MGACTNPDNLTLLLLCILTQDLGSLCVQMDIQMLCWGILFPAGMVLGLTRVSLIHSHRDFELALMNQKCWLNSQNGMFLGNQLPRSSRWPASNWDTTMEDAASTTPFTAPLHTFASGSCWHKWHSASSASCTSMKTPYGLPLPKSTPSSASSFLWSLGPKSFLASLWVPSLQILAGLHIHVHETDPWRILLRQPRRPPWPMSGSSHYGQLLSSLWHCASSYGALWVRMAATEGRLSRVVGLHQ